MKNKYHRKVKILLGLALIFCWLGWDFYQANVDEFTYRSFIVTPPAPQTKNPSVVSIVRSNDTALAHPSSLDSILSYQTVEEMVRRAVQLAGGFEGRIQSGMKVLIKPNIVEQQESGSGNVTDVRVVEALVRMIDQIDHGNIQIIVGDGSPRPFTTFEKANAFGKTPWVQLFDVPGYQTLKTNMLAAGINFRLSNLNGNSDTNPIPELQEVSVPGGGSATPQAGKYFLHQDVINADVYITVPVMKIHDPGITSVLKNQIGIAPSSLYGFSKTAGTPADNYRHKLQHTAQAPYMWTDKEIVDLSTLAKIKFVVVDALMCLDIQKTIMSGNANQVRMNSIIASSDPVAADHICARIMRLNPDDIEHITLAERQGLGTNDPANIIIRGASVEGTMKRFRKNSAVEEQRFGQSNRNWLLKGTYSITGITNPMNYQFIPNEAQAAPLPGADGWSNNVYFINDRINLKDYFQSVSSPVNSVVAYAYTNFTAPANQQVELWVGSDEALKIYLNGNVVYDYSGSRTFSANQKVSEIKTITIQKGENRLLVKALQNVNSSYFDFSLNICAPDTNRYFAGSRVWGLKFHTSPLTAVDNNDVAKRNDYQLFQNYPNPFNPSTTIAYQIQKAGFVSLVLFDARGRAVTTLVNETKVAGKYSVRFNAGNLSSGVYFYTLKAGEFISTKKLIVLK